MTGPEVLDVARDAIVTLVLVSAPLTACRADRRRRRFSGAGIDANSGSRPWSLCRKSWRSSSRCCSRCRSWPTRCMRIWCGIAARIIGGADAPSQMQIDLSFLPALGAAFILVFARIGAMVMLLPGLGEDIPARVRLTIALILTLVLLPLHRAAYHSTCSRSRPGGHAGARDHYRRRAGRYGARHARGLAGGRLGHRTAARAWLRHIGRSDSGPAGRIVGNFLTLLGITLLFATDTHYLVIAALNDSYKIFSAGRVPRAATWRRW